VGDCDRLLHVDSARTWRRWLQRPWVTAVLLLVLGADFARLYHANIGVGWLVRDAIWVIQHPGVVRDQFGQDYYFALDGSAISPLFRDGESADRFARMVSGEPQNVLNVHLSPRRSLGPWTAAYEERGIDVSRMDGSPVNDQTWRAAVAMVSDEVDAAGERAAAAELRENPRGTSRILWSGVTHNLVVLVMVALLIVSLGWLPRWMRSLRRQPWQCRGCGYDLRGSDGVKCPECGANQSS